MTQIADRVTYGRSDDEDRLNEQFHALLRDAAEKREGRARAQSSEDDAAAKRESADLLALARSQTRERRDRVARTRD